MSNKKLLLLNGIMLCLLGLIHLLFCAKISSLVFPTIEVHSSLIQIYQVLSIHMLSLGVISLLIRKVKYGSSLEKNVLLAYSLYWLMSSSMGFYHLNKGVDALLSIQAIQVIFTLIFSYSYVKARKKD